MPIPKPRPGENQNEFMQRCMGDEKMKDEYPNMQRYPVCQASWERAKHDQLKTGLSQRSMSSIINNII